MNRRNFLKLGGAAVVTAVVPKRVLAENYVPYKVSKKYILDLYEKKGKSPYIEGTTRIGLFAARDAAKHKHPGRVLHASKNSRGGPNCHIVKIMGENGEFKIIDVACRN